MSKKNNVKYSPAEKRAFYTGYGVGYRDNKGPSGPFLDKFSDKKSIDSFGRGFLRGRKHASREKGKKKK